MPLTSKCSAYSAESHLVSEPCKKFTKSAQSSGPENIGPKRTLPGHRAPGPVLSPSRITLENNEKIRPQPDREHAFAGAGGGEGGIRTLGTLARSTVFETAPFDHSGTSPSFVQTVSVRLGRGGHITRVTGETSLTGRSPQESSIAAANAAQGATETAPHQCFAGRFGGSGAGRHSAKARVLRIRSPKPRRS